MKLRLAETIHIFSKDNDKVLKILNFKNNTEFELDYTNEVVDILKFLLDYQSEKDILDRFKNIPSNA